MDKTKASNFVPPSNLCGTTPNWPFAADIHLKQTCLEQEVEQTSQTTAITRNVQMKALRLDHEFDSCDFPTSHDCTQYETTSVWATDRPSPVPQLQGHPCFSSRFRIFLFSVAAFVAVGASLVIELFIYKTKASNFVPLGDLCGTTPNWPFRGLVCESPECCLAS